MNTKALVCAVLLAACGEGGENAQQPGGGAQPLTGTPPPPVSLLPDGGMSAMPTDAQRLRTMLQWFTANVKHCSVRLDAVNRDYATASLRIYEWDIDDDYTVYFELGGPASTDTYQFKISFRYHETIELRPYDERGGTLYRYSTTYGRSRDLYLVVEAHDARLRTDNADGDVTIECESLPY